MFQEDAERTERSEMKRKYQYPLVILLLTIFATLGMFLGMGYGFISSGVPIADLLPYMPISLMVGGISISVFGGFIVYLLIGRNKK